VVIVNLFTSANFCDSRAEPHGTQAPFAASLHGDVNAAKYFAAQGVNEGTDDNFVNCRFDDWVRVRAPMRGIESLFWDGDFLFFLLFLFCFLFLF